MAGLFLEAGVPDSVDLAGCLAWGGVLAAGVVVLAGAEGLAGAVAFGAEDDAVRGLVGADLGATEVAVGFAFPVFDDLADGCSGTTIGAESESDFLVGLRALPEMSSSRREETSASWRSGGSFSVKRAEKLGSVASRRSCLQKLDASDFLMGVLRCSMASTSDMEAGSSPSQ